MNYIDMRLICYFNEIAKYLNFTRAAEILFISQSSLSRQIQELERELGVTLFIRNNKMVKLTRAGEVLYQESKALIAKMESAVERTRRAAQYSCRDIMIACITIDCNDLLIDLVKRFQKDVKDTKVHMDSCLAGTVTDSLLRDAVDIGYTTEYEIHNVPFLDFLPYRKSTFMLLVPESSRFAGRDSVSLAELSDENFVFYKDYGKQKLLECCEENGFTPKCITTYNIPISIESLIIQVQMGVGLTFIPSDVGLRDRPGVKLIPIRGKMPEVAMGFTWKRGTDNASVFNFVEFVKNTTAAE